MKKIFTHPFVFYSLLFILFSGMGSMMSGIYDPESFYGGYTNGLLTGVVVGGAFGLIFYWILSLIPQVILKLVPSRYHHFLRYVFIFLTIILGLVFGKFIAVSMTI